MAGKHRKPSTARKTAARAGAAASLAVLGLAQPAAAETGGASSLDHQAPAVSPPAAVPVHVQRVAAPVPAVVPESAPAAEIVVASGDTLSELARDRTDAADWQALYEQNHAVIGDNPDLIFPGQVLHYVGGIALPTAPAPLGESAPAPAPPAPAPAPAPAVELGHAPVSNSAGPLQPQAQHAADMVFTHVPGAQLITMGGTRGSARDPNGHPSGLAVDYMVGGDSALGDAIVAFHIAHWDELGVDYIIWQQRILQDPGGQWQGMEDRGSPTQNHMDHPHVNYHG